MASSGHHSDPSGSKGEFQAVESDYYDDVHVTLVPSDSIAGSSNPDVKMVIDLPASGSVTWYPGELKHALRRIAQAQGVGNYVLTERSTEVNWGASGGALEILLELATSAGDATIAFAVQAALQELLARKGFHRRGQEWMDEQAMVDVARHRLALRYRLPAGDLQLIEQAASADGSGVVVFHGPDEWRYEVKLRRERALPSVTEFRRSRVPEG